MKRFNFITEIDDLVLAPISIPELDVRIKKALKKKKSAGFEKIIEAEGLIINPVSYEVTVEDMPVKLTYKEFELLKLLVSNRGMVFSRDSLLNTVWGYAFHQETRTVDNHIRRIRAKLGVKFGSKIKTIRKIGYKFAHH